MTERRDGMTYTRCPVCDGSGRLGARFGAPSCPCTRGPTPGYVPTGLTLRQIDRMVERERALAGDPGVPEDRRRELILALVDPVREQAELLSRSAEGGRRG